MLLLFFSALFAYYFNLIALSFNIVKFFYVSDNFYLNFNFFWMILHIR